LEFHRRSVALSPETWTSLDALANAEGVTKSELVRRIINVHLVERGQPQFNPQRMAVICEYVQLVADEWVKKHAPDRRDEFLAVVDQRMDRHHGG
jgi:predicted DNA-binding ribbon-helix-helix protein